MSHAGRLAANVAATPVEAVTAPAGDTITQVNVAASPQADRALEIRVARFRIRIVPGHQNARPVDPNVRRLAANLDRALRPRPSRAILEPRASELESSRGGRYRQKSLNGAETQLRVSGRVRWRADLVRSTPISG
jgi:hypothetical protein